MKKFIQKLLLLVFVPFILLLGIYIWSDPFKNLHPFTLQDFDETNRDYLSTELFLKNNPTEKYDSFVFGSSKTGGINTYRWLKYLPKGSHQFLFQAWGETITGIEQKIYNIDRIGNNINNVLILIDIPGSFVSDQEPTTALGIKHFKFSGKSKLYYHFMFFYSFIKPSFIYESIQNKIFTQKAYISFDTISNDWDRNNKYNSLNYPVQDSLNQTSEQGKRVFFAKINASKKEIKVSDRLITDKFEDKLISIKNIFNKHETNYKIVISPAFCYTNPRINPKDLKILQDIFGQENVYNFSGKNHLTEDFNNFSDPNHFGQIIGWQLIEEIYTTNLD